MPTQFKKQNFSIYYIVLTAADFIYGIFNLIRQLIETEFTAAELFTTLRIIILYLLPLIAFIFVSKEAAEIEDVEKRIKIKNYVIIYLIASLIYGFLKYLLNRLCSWNLPIIPSCLFYSSSWLFSLEMVIKYHFFSSIVNLVFHISFLVISIMFIKSLSKEILPEEEFKEGIGKTSTGYILGIVSIVVLSIQTVLNIMIAVAMHENMSGVSGEHAIGAAFVVLILIAFKLLLSFIFLPAIPLSIIGLVKCNSKKEIEQDRKYRLPGRTINIICLVIAVLELIMLW